MSRTLICARLFRFKGPVERSTSRDIQRFLDAHEWVTENMLTSAARLASAFLGSPFAFTLDGYRWFWNGVFAVKGGHCAILIPWFQDWKRVDGSGAERAIAIYTRGVIEDDVIDAMLERFQFALLAVVAATGVPSGPAVNPPCRIPTNEQHKAPLL